jgi:hypothetical protein
VRSTAIFKTDYEGILHALKMIHTVSNIARKKNKSQANNIRNRYYCNMICPKDFGNILTAKMSDCAWKKCGAANILKR